MKFYFYSVVVFYMLFHDVNFIQWMRPVQNMNYLMSMKMSVVSEQEKIMIGLWVCMINRLSVCLINRLWVCMINKTVSMFDYTVGLVVVFNTTFNNISFISWWSVFLVEEIGVPGENH